MNKWGEDHLSTFLERVHQNQKANLINFAEPYAILTKIDECFVKAGQHLINPKPLMNAILLLRCQYAFKTACGMALSGQIVETFVMMRSVLEYAGYALVIFETPALEEVFMNRHQGDTEMKMQKQAFRVKAVSEAVGRFDAKLAQLFDLFYQRTIDFGGHPNPHATFSSMKLDEREDNTGVTAIALSTDPMALLHAMKSVGQVGLTALHIFQHVFKEKFELLSIRAEIDTLRQSGGL